MRRIQTENRSADQRRLVPHPVAALLPLNTLFPPSPRGGPHPPRIFLSSAPVRARAILRSPRTPAGSASITGGVPCGPASSPRSPTAFEPMRKRRRGFPSESRVRRGDRVVHGDKELTEKLGRDDLCPCGS